MIKKKRFGNAYNKAVKNNCKNVSCMITDISKLHEQSIYGQSGNIIPWHFCAMKSQCLKHGHCLNENTKQQSQESSLLTTMASQRWFTKVHQKVKREMLEELINNNRSYSVSTKQGRLEMFDQQQLSQI